MAIILLCSSLRSLQAGAFNDAPFHVSHHVNRRWLVFLPLQEILELAPNLSSWSGDTRFSLRNYTVAERDYHVPLLVGLAGSKGEGYFCGRFVARMTLAVVLNYCGREETRQL